MRFRVCVIVGAKCFRGVRRGLDASMEVVLRFACVRDAEFHCPRSIGFLVFLEFPVFLCR